MILTYCYCKPVINPVQDITWDGRPMEGTTYPEHPALGVSLDSGLRAGMSSIEPMRQLVLNTLSVIQPDETDRPEHPAPASQMHCEQSCLNHRRGRCRIRILMIIQMSMKT